MMEELMNYLEVIDKSNESFMSECIKKKIYSGAVINVLGSKGYFVTHRFIKEALAEIAVDGKINLLFEVPRKELDEKLWEILELLYNNYATDK